MNNFQQTSIDPAKIRPFVIIGIAIIVLIIILSKIFVILQPTERGVVFKKYTSGLDVDDVKTEGLNIVAPWNEVIIFDIAERQVEETMSVLTKDGLSIAIDVSLRFRPQPDRIGYLYEAFRDSYVENFIRPEFRSAVRQVVGKYNPEEIYASKRLEIEKQIEEKIMVKLEENNVELKALLFRGIQLPDMIKSAIEQKLSAEQEAQKYEFLIMKEKKEAERRKIDAEGKAIANEILDKSITQNILREKGISATQELSNSPNSKIIIIGGGGDGLPIILNTN